jgi:5'-methylthioadenosine phosphorylase
MSKRRVPTPPSPSDNEPVIGIIGGSGLYAMEGLTEARWVQVKTPFGSPSDQLLRGRLCGREVAFLPRHGRGHRIMPSELNHRANLWAMKKLGVAWIISVSAVGSLQARFKPRDIVAIDQFFDRTKKALEHTFFGSGIVGHIAFAEPICAPLRKLLVKAARAAGARIHDGGSYVCMEGPAFSTRAESRFNHRAGFDVIGMTNLGEAKCAREAEISYATLAMVTDYDCWKDDEAHVTVDVVLENLKANAAMAQEVLRRTLPSIPRTACWESHRALQSSILTPPEHWPASTRKALAPILARVTAEASKD